ncbi:MAG: SCP2 domain-containing protein [Gammaproteobacteria bacterium]
MLTALPALKQFLSMVPDPWHQEVISWLVNHLMQGQPHRARISSLEGKVVRLIISDTHNQWQFAIRNGRLFADHRLKRSWNVCIRGNLQDFLLLALRIEDPDTLFFSRRLSLEGETEAGLYVKNLLDALEFDWVAHVNAVFGDRPAALAFEALRQTRVDHALSLLGRSIHRSLVDMVTPQN